MQNLSLDLRERFGSDTLARVIAGPQHGACPGRVAGHIERSAGPAESAVDGLARVRARHAGGCNRR